MFRSLDLFSSIKMAKFMIIFMLLVFCVETVTSARWQFFPASRNQPKIKDFWSNLLEVLLVPQPLVMICLY
jgi:uncharacterized integral membrane protein